MHLGACRLLKHLGLRERQRQRPIRNHQLLTNPQNTVTDPCAPAAVVGDAEAEAETEGESDALGLREGDADALAETLGEIEALGLREGDADDDAETLGDTEADALRVGLAEALGEIEADGETEAEGEIEALGEIEADGDSVPHTVPWRRRYRATAPDTVVRSAAGAAVTSANVRSVDQLMLSADC